MNSLPFWNYDIRVIEKFRYDWFKPRFDPLSDSLKLSLEGDYLSLLSLCFPIWKMKIIVSTSQSYHWNRRTHVMQPAGSKCLINVLSLLCLIKIKIKNLD